MLKWYLTALSGLSLLFSLSGSIVLTENGKAASVIVTPDKPNQVEEFAAQELQYHLERMSGAKIPVVPEKELKETGARSCVFIGQTAAAAKNGITVEDLPPSGWKIRSIGCDLYLTGKDRMNMPPEYAHFWMWDYWRCNWKGSLFAVYDLLEKEFGVLWLWPGELGESIPKRKSISLDSIDRTGKPFFKSTRFVVWKWNQWNGKLGWKSKASRTKFYRDQDLFRLRHRISVDIFMSKGHSFQEYWRQYGKSHPEFFSKLPDGTRRPLEGNPDGTNITMCVSNTGLHENIISNWKVSPMRKLRNGNHMPYMPYVQAEENDTPGMCVCEQCRAWDAPDPAFRTNPYWSGQKMLTNGTRFQITFVDWGEDGGSAQEAVPSLSDRYAKFYNALARKAKQIDSEAKVVGYAYANYMRPPRETRMEDNVIIEYVPSTFFPYTGEQSRIQHSDISGWWKKGVREFIYRPNYMFAGANLPLLWSRQIAEDVVFAVKYGASSVTFDGWGGAYAAQGPMMYTCMRLMVDPMRPLDKILEEYYSAFGSASGEVRAYFDYWTALTDSVTMAEYLKYSNAENGVGFKNFVKIAPYLIKPENFKEGYKLLREAEKASEGDKTVLARIAFLKKGLRDAELTTAAAKARSHWSRNPGDRQAKDAFYRAFNHLKEYRGSIEQDNICNYTHMACWEAGGSQWPWEKMADQ